jgi:hypothetical protein
VSFQRILIAVDGRAWSVAGSRASHLPTWLRRANERADD